MLGKAQDKARSPNCGIEADETTATKMAEFKCQTCYFLCKGRRIEFEDGSEA